MIKSVARVTAPARYPLYTFTGDSRPGATSGQGLQAFGASWHALTATGKEVTGG
jgi:hypothetical protein